MEEVAVIMQGVNPNFWRGKRVFLTGHTGFKGSWLSLWLQSLGAELHGFSLVPSTTPSLFIEAEVEKGMRSTIGDIRNYDAVLSAMQACKPDIVIHMAAQPLVRYSYGAPVETYATNVMGTVHVLEAARHVGSSRAIVNITTDKCYENREWAWGYRENEAVGGRDPYSNSKACAELVSSAYRQSFLEPAGIALATARAGNVIGGGDWALDRLIPDILRALQEKQPVSIRNPHAIRPWQHVLEPLSGYLVLAERLYLKGQADAESWNFGPRDEDARTVQWIVDHLCDSWGDGSSWLLQPGEHPHEASFLKLDISKSRQRLGWAPRWTLETALSQITEWHKTWLSGDDIRSYTQSQIDSFAHSA